MAFAKVSFSVTVLQLRTEMVPIHIRKYMVLDYYDGQMITGDACSLNFLTFILQLTKNAGKNLNQEIHPTRD